jgi:hypothetical protein
MITQPFLPEPVQSPLRVPTVSVHDDPRWEHRRIVRNLRKEDPPTESELDALGADGWELTGLFSDAPFLYLYLKRPIY